jgi:hypothetical protein
MVAGPTKSGIIASGPAMTDETGVVTADTYTVAWGGTSFEPTGRQMSVTKMYDMAGTTYRGRFYVIGASESEVGGWVFASEPVETLAQPGDAPEPDEPSEPGPGQPNVINLTNAWAGMPRAGCVTRPRGTPTATAAGGYCRRRTFARVSNVSAPHRISVGARA